jgi:hypothetical protein
MSIKKWTYQHDFIGTGIVKNMSLKIGHIGMLLLYRYRQNRYRQRLKKNLDLVALTTPQSSVLTTPQSGILNLK